MSAVAAPRATRAEKDRLLEDFVRLCAIESPSRRERAMADAVTADLRELGLEVHEDGTASETGSDSGNLLARIAPPPGSERSILLCAHLDTVPLAAPVEVVVEEGVVSNANEAILGADNKAAVAVILAVARRLARGEAPVGVEILFTTCEELALLGAKAFDTGALRSDFGFVFDHASPVGELILAAPTYYSIEARFRGQAAHAGLCPERGHNAIEAAAAGVAALELGRLDPGTTANVGKIEGGSAANVVADRCRVELEARSLDAARAAEVTSSIVDTLTRAASDRECDVDLLVDELFRGFRIARSAEPVQAASAALEAVGIEPVPISTGGGSDANAFQARGFQCLNVANGTYGAHQIDESVSVDALETMLDVVLGIVAHSAATPAPEHDPER
ncbi:MAG: tripeptide aminopeptidase [Thermoleophilaceae bacterium]|nr:tripeptide aminopeptidase [Thermoleophilaceae bacterium]